jgi:teichuronic acid biosynthesis glycosyltransferase TuaG
MISILMPIYNGIEFIDESISTILYQNYPHWELIIGVNGHPPNSEVFNIAKSYELINSKIKVYDLHNISGKSNSLNEMVKMCNYDWISLLDVDDKWLPNKLSSQIPYMDKFDVIGTQCKYFGNMNVSPNLPIGNISSFDFFKFNPIINSSCLIKKEHAHWEEPILEDYDLWLKLRKQGKLFYNVSDIQVMHRIHNDSSFNAKGNHLKVNYIKSKYA